MTLAITCKHCKKSKSLKVDRLPVDVESILKAIEYSKTEGGFVCAACGRVREARATA